MSANREYAAARSIVAGAGAHPQAVAEVVASNDRENGY